MSEVGEPFDCRNCGRRIEGEKEGFHGLCQACRAEVVRRSTTWAALPALVVAALYLWLLSWGGLFQSRFMIVFLALGLALAWVAFKIARRVLFDVIRNRGVPAPKKKSKA